MKKFNRRNFINSAALGTAALSGLSFKKGEELLSSSSSKEDLKYNNDGTYPTVPLTKQNIRLTVVQSRVRGVDEKNPKPGLQANIEHMKLCIDRAFNFSAPSDILFFHEFPITGFKVWTRKEALRVAIEIPGEETEQIAAKAKEYGCYIVFGSYAQDKDWPNHLLSITTIINPKGEVIAKHWKARNIKGVFPGIELYTTTIYDVLDRYVEMYGEDEIIPITRTPIGNIATSSVQREPELFRAFAMKGAEIMLRTATGGFTPIDIQACAMYNGFYTAIVNNAVSPDNGLFFESSGSTGGSAIYDPRGNEMAHAGTQMETSVGASIPIGAYRQRNRQPFVHMDLYRHVFDKYRNAYPPNLMAGEELPKDIYDAKRFFKDKSVWK